MSQFLDGPAAGIMLHLRRAPMLLRVVQGPRGTWDALDQIEDAPRRDETVCVYVLQGPPSRSHVLARGKDRDKGGWFESGQYALASYQPTAGECRNNEGWQRWCAAHRELVKHLYAKPTRS